MCLTARLKLSLTALFRILFRKLQRGGSCLNRRKGNRRSFLFVKSNPPSRLDAVCNYAYHGGVTASELRRWLKEHGCRFEDGTRHTFAILRNKVVTIPRHPSQEINTKTLHSILKRLGLRMQ